MPMNPVDVFFGIVQGIVAIILLVKMDSIGLPSALIYFLVLMLVISGVWDLFD